MDKEKNHIKTPTSIMPPLLTPDDVAKYLSISKTRVYNLLRSKGFPSLKVGKHWRVDPLLLRDWVENKAKERI